MEHHGRASSPYHGTWYGSVKTPWCGCPPGCCGASVRHGDMHPRTLRKGPFLLPHHPFPCFYISHPLLHSLYPVPHPPGTPPTSSLQPSRVTPAPPRSGRPRQSPHPQPWGGTSLAAVGVHNLLDGRPQELDLPVLVRPGHAADQRFASAPRLLDELADAREREKTLSPSASPGIV